MCRTLTCENRQQATAHLAKIRIFDGFSTEIDCSREALLSIDDASVQDVSKKRARCPHYIYPMLSSLVHYEIRYC